MLNLVQVVLGIPGLWLLAFGIGETVIARNPDNPDGFGFPQFGYGSLTPKTWKFWAGLSLSTARPARGRGGARRHGAAAVGVDPGRRASTDHGGGRPLRVGRPHTGGAERRDAAAGGQASTAEEEHADHEVVRGLGGHPRRRSVLPQG